MNQTTKFLKFLEGLNKPKGLREVRQIEAERQELDQYRKEHSADADKLEKRQAEFDKNKQQQQELLERIHEFSIKHECKRSLRGCLIGIALEHATDKNYKRVIKLIELPIRALTEPNLDMVDQHFTLVNNAFKKKFGENSDQHVWSKKSLHLTPEEKKMRSEMASQRRMEKNTNPHEILDTKVYKLILRGQELTADWQDKFISIALSCGARLVEIASAGVSMFSESKEAPGQLHQAGVAKDEHGTKVRGDQRHVDKPVIKLTVQELLAMIQEARQLLRDEKKNVPELYALLQQSTTLTADEKKLITNRIGAPLNERVKQVLGEEYHFHSLRAIYGNLSYQLYGSSMSVNAWLSRVLGHKPGSINTAAAYTTVKVSKQLPQEHTDVKDLITELRTQVEALKQEIAKRKTEVLEEATEVVEKKLENISRAQGVKLMNDDGQEVLFQRQPRIHDGRQMERLMRAVVDLEKHKVRVNWPSLRALGFGDKVISDYFKSADQLPDQRRPKRRKTSA